MDEFRELVIREWNPAAKKGGQQQSVVWRYATGGGDRVLRISLHDSLADRDAPNPTQKGMTPLFSGGAKHYWCVIIQS